MIPLLLAGVPTIAPYERLLESESFAAIERFSHEFLATHHGMIRPYARKWVADPLHQWNRQWEYPFVFSRLWTELQDRKEPTRARILDAGSGVTFLPFLVAAKFEIADMYCCDWDSSLAPIFSALNDSMRTSIEFFPADLHALPFKSECFDIVYSISVLEHTDRRAMVTHELHRVLKPGGRFIVTFGLPVRQTAAADDELEELLSALAQRFDDDDNNNGDPRRVLSSSELLTTTYAATIDKALLPWRHLLLYRLSCLLAGRGWVEWPPALTVACMSMTKPAPGRGEAHEHD
jgi:SAM-dependent methyltransferase